MKLEFSLASDGSGTRFAAAAAILCATLAASAFTERRRPEQLAQPLKSVPLSIADWKFAGDAPLPPSTLKRLVPSDYISRIYSQAGKPLGLFIAYYAEQRAGESMHSPKHCLPGSGWEIWKYDSVSIPFHGSAVRVNKYYIHQGNDRQVVLYWYQSRSRIIASEYLGKFLLMKDAALNGRTDGALVRIVVPDDPDIANQAVKFAAELIPYVERCYGARNS
ncbi:MAG TPA: EpsI family protein [Bryobacteraceae bacterium]|nr:EpsI family protein [Bryobacteraceae bacterium]